MSYGQSINPKELVSDLRSLPVASPLPRTLRTRLAELARDAVLAWKHGRSARASARALAALNDRQLRDIGVNRVSIPEIARAAAWAHLAMSGLDHGAPWERDRF